MKTSTSNSGFTILELLAAVTLIAVLVVVAAPNLSAFIQRSSIRADTQNVVKLITTARMAAMVESEQSSIICWNSGSSVSSISDGTTTHSLPAGDIIAASGNVSAAGELGEILVQSRLSQQSNLIVDTDGDNCFGFNSQGRLTGTSVDGVALTFCKASGNSTDARRIEVSPGGRVTQRLNTDTAGAGVRSCS